MKVIHQTKNERRPRIRTRVAALLALGLVIGLVPVANAAWIELPRWPEGGGIEIRLGVEEDSSRVVLTGIVVLGDPLSWFHDTAGGASGETRAVTPAQRIRATTQGFRQGVVALRALRRSVITIFKEWIRVTFESRARTRGS